MTEADVRKQAAKSTSKVQSASTEGSERVALTTLFANIFALLLITMSVTMLGDFTRRLFGADPDELGMFAIAVQAVFTIGATGAFTGAGWTLLHRLLGRDVKMSTAWRLSATTLCFIFTAVIWMWAPHWLAVRYNDQAFFLDQALTACERGDASCDIKLTKNPAHYRAKALQNYQRAVSLDPALWQARTSSGKVLESFYRFQEAEEQYRKALQAEPSDEVDFTPYSNLARALIMDGKPKDALRVIADAQHLGASGPYKEVLARDKAWAEYDLGFYAAAAEDSAASGSAAALCIQAQAYAKLGRRTDEQMTWAKFHTQLARVTWDDPVVNPECTLLEEVSNAKP